MWKWRIDPTNESVNNSQPSSATFIIQRWSTPNKERFGGLVLIDCWKKRGDPCDNDCRDRQSYLGPGCRMFVVIPKEDRQVRSSNLKDSRDRSVLNRGQFNKTFTSVIYKSSLRASSPGRTGGGAGKVRRACNFVSGIWIPPPIPVAPRRLSCQISANQREEERAGM